MKRRHALLVIEDHESTRRAMVEVSEAVGFEVTGVGSQEETFAVLAERSFCACTLDREIPVRPGGGAHLEIGEATLRRLREDHPHLRIFLVTGNAELDFAVEALKLGAADFAAKPVKGLGKRVQSLVDRCEERHPHGCPYLASAPRSSGPRLILNGHRKGQRFVAHVGEKECLLREKEFRALLLLALAAKEGASYSLEELARKKNPYTILSELRKALSAAGLHAQVIKNVSEGEYRLDLPPDQIAIDPEKTMHGRFKATIENFSLEG